MSKMREAMPVFIIAFIVLFVGFIVLNWGMDITGMHHTGVEENIGVINGTNIPYKDFEKQVNTQVDQQKQQRELTEDDEAQIRDMVWEREVTNTMMLNELNKLGLSVTDQEVRDMLLNDPPPYLKRGFTDSMGNFDIARYQSVLQMYASYEPTGEDTAKDKHMDSVYNELVEVTQNIRETKEQGLFESALGACAPVTDEDIHEKIYNDNSHADAAYIQFDISTIPDNNVVAPDDSIKAYYDKNPEEFPQQPSRKAKYAFFNMQPSESDSSSVMKKLQVLEDSLHTIQDTARRNQYFQLASSRYNELETQNDAFQTFKDLSGPKGTAILSTPLNGYSEVVPSYDGFHVYHVLEEKPGETEYIRTRQILIAYGNNRDSARSFADTIIKKLKTDSKAHIEDAARILSADQVTAQKGGDAGYVAKGTMAPALEKAAWSAPIGEVEGPIETDRGWYIIKVLDRGNRDVRVYDLKIQVHISTQTKAAITHQAQFFRDRIRKGENVDTVAANMKIHVFESQALTRATPMLGSTDLTQWVYSSKLGDVSDPKKVRGGSIVVLQLSSVKEKGTKPFDEVKSLIRQKILTMRKLDNLVAKAEPVMRILNGDSLEKAMRYDTTIKVQYASGVKPSGPIQGLGTDYNFSAALYSLNNPGQIAGPIRSSRGVFIIQLRSKAVPSDSMYALQRGVVLTSIITQEKSSFVQSWIAKQKENAIIDDKRETFYPNF